MCLNLKETFKRRDSARAFTKAPLVTGRAIKTYKILCLDEESGELDKLYSPHRSSVYKPSEEKKVSKFSFTITDACGWRIAVNKGLHSYKTKELALAVIDTYVKSKRTCIVVECTIPKGTPYFKNAHEFVSLQLNLPCLSFSIDKKKKLATPSKEWTFCKELSFSEEISQFLLEN